MCIRDRTMAIKFDPGNEKAKLALVKLARSSHEVVRNEASKIYDAKSDPTPPVIVLIELANQAKDTDDLESAMKFLEAARRVDPRNPEILSKLALVYLELEKPNPERALLLIDQGIVFLRIDSRHQPFANYVRARALEELDRIVDAEASYEAAIAECKDNELLLEIKERFELMKRRNLTCTRPAKSNR